jgi:competence transcription factor ComK
LLTRYFINNETYAFHSNFDSCGDENSKVIEKERKIKVRKSPLKIVQDSYKHIGSDYNGAVRGARAILNRRNHIPVVYSGPAEIVLIQFPTTDHLGKIWIVNKYIDDVKPMEEDSTLIQMVNGHTIEIGLRFQLVHDRRMEATFLQTIALQRHSIIL